jgi:glycosyltransferase involved in cell wall biosynthesis
VANHSQERSIAFVINSLGPGGAERVLDNLLQMTPRDGWAPHLILLDQERDFRTPPAFVTVHRLNCHFGLIESIRQVRAKLIELQPKLVVSFLVRANVASVIAARAVGAPCIISERSQLSTHMAEEYPGLKRLPAIAVPRLAYPRADHVIAVSQGVRSDLIAKFGVKRTRVSSIPNPYDLGRIARDAAADPEFALPQRFIVSAGRLVKRKGFDDLLDAYARAQPPLPLCILGEGVEQARLNAKVGALGLSRRVCFLGYAKNPFAIVARAEMFVSPSHCEGFPNAIAEAMALGVPVVSTDCPSGPAELLDDVETVDFQGVHAGKYGLLMPVGRPDLLAQGILRMSEPEARAHYSAQARRRMDDYRIEAIAARYWKTFETVLADAAATARKRARREPAAA